MIAIGLDIGGTKIATRVFDPAWQIAAHARIATPRDYSTLLSVIAAQIAWAQTHAATPLPVGVGAAGVINPQTGGLLAANLCANGQPLPADLARAIGGPVTYLNDARAFALSESIFGAGREARRVMSLILGTGVGGGIVVDGALQTARSGLAGEIGHMAAPAHLIATHNLPIFPCGCGRHGCLETYISGPGLERLAQHLTGHALTAPEIAARRTADMDAVWHLWCALVAELIHSITLIADPERVVIGGGLSKINGVADDLEWALGETMLAGFAGPQISIAEGGDTSGARGAAYAAWQAAQRDH